MDGEIPFTKMVDNYLIDDSVKASARLIWFRLTGTRLYIPPSYKEKDVLTRVIEYYLNINSVFGNPTLETLSKFTKECGRTDLIQLINDF